ncbi:MAG TPA: HPP family protein [Sulfuricurvum sp.]|nr:HPP family protein [Sulfuricurvum sp.]
MHNTDHTKKRLLHIAESIIAGVGALLGLSFIGVIAQSAHTMMLIAPFGATAVLLFSAPNSPFSNPWNVFGGYFISTVIGAVVLTYTNAQWLPIAIGLGLVIMLMHGFKVIHPPAGANFLIVTQGHLSFYLMEPLIIGLITLLIVAMSIQRIKKKFLT